MRIIDADQAKALAEICMGDIFLQTAAKLLLDKTPTVDAVPVVRCRDCKRKTNALCPMETPWHITGDDSFCSYGERKDND